MSMIIMVKVTPNAQKNELIEFVDSILKVRVKAPPDKGKASKQLPPKVGSFQLT
ncbi:MAG: DUF167 domain-containing protein [Chlamydiae bacterium]|nr:DUF167 domain-containing protein [Chlamydiota bacterium]